MSQPNETFALGVLSLLTRTMGLSLVKDGRPNSDEVIQGYLRGSGGERGMLDVAMEAWTLSTTIHAEDPHAQPPRESHLSSGFFAVLAKVDVRTRNELLDLFSYAYSPPVDPAVVGYVDR